MNNVQSYNPPRLAALGLAAAVFAAYHVGWSDLLREGPRTGTPVPLPLAVLFSLIIGYGLAMLGWLIARTKWQVFETFRPTRGRILGAFSLAMVMPIAVFSYVPWIIVTLPFIALGAGLKGVVYAIPAILLPSLLAYPIAAMILRHTYQRRALRFALFALCFWTAYSAHMLWSGVVIFRL
jgi:hypothetical protein